MNRFKSHYGQVRTAYQKRADTDAAIADFRRAKEEAATIASQTKGKTTP